MRRSGHRPKGTFQPLFEWPGTNTHRGATWHQIVRTGGAAFKFASALKPIVSLTQMPVRGECVLCSATLTSCAFPASSPLRLSLDWPSPKFRGVVLVDLHPCRHILAVMAVNFDAILFIDRPTKFFRAPRHLNGDSTYYLNCLFALRHRN
jgi:hypothetical protein